MVALVQRQNEQMVNSLAGRKNWFGLSQPLVSLDMLSKTQWALLGTSQRATSVAELARADKFAVMFWHIN